MVDAAVLTEGINAVWVLTVTFLIFFMQAGFAMLEAGNVRAKNAGNVLMKNMMDWSMGVLVYFFVGLGIAGIAAGLTAPGGYSVAESFSYVNDPGAWIGWLFGAVFAMTAATIVSGAVAEQLKFRAYLFYSVGITAFIYPAIQGFAWGGGLLSGSGYLGAAFGTGYLDFAGATVVHMLGGVAGLVGAYMVGPRKGRYTSAGKSIPIPGHSVPLVVLGTLMLAFGWYGFNVGTQATVLAVEAGALVFKGEALGRVAINTTLGMGAGAVGTTAYTWIKDKPDPVLTANGLLAGLVAVTGAVPHVTVWGGISLGLIAGIQVPLVYRFVVDKMKVDDVCGVFAVHGSAGAIGTLLIPVFAVSGFSAAQLGMQAAGILVITVWTVVTTYAVFKVAEVTVGLRVSDAEETEGLDKGEHGVSAYPEFGTEARGGEGL
ncbi:MAG: putative ammonium transporter [Methanonatronarchaeales archaeon]|nr:putative ammonium transporter [Methanonatronarchaeales archaeon]